MSAMIDRVAWAILKARYYDIEPHMYADCESFEADVRENHLEEARAEARAAIEAMREPTVKMLRAADSVRLSDEELPAGLYEDIRAEHIAMIDAALSD